MNVKGKIKSIGETKTFGNNGFRKRDLVLISDEQYPQFLLIEFVQDKTEILDNYKQGDDVEIGINLRGREWIDPEGLSKYFNSIQGWRIEKYDGAAEENTDYMPAEPIGDTDTDDLPF